MVINVVKLTMGVAPLSLGPMVVLRHSAYSRESQSSVGRYICANKRLLIPNVKTPKE